MDEQLQIIADSIARIQEMLIVALQSAVTRQEVSSSILACHLSKVVCEKQPVFVLKIFDIFVRKFVRSDLDNVPQPQLVLLFSCFMWSLCYLDKSTTALTMALLHGDCKSQTITGKDLKRMFKLLYGMQIENSHNLRVFAQRCTSEVITFARARARVLATSEPSEISALEYPVPNAVFLKFLAKTPKSYMWPMAMMQDQWRRFMFGEEFWVSMREQHSHLFAADVSSPSNTHPNANTQIHSSIAPRMLSHSRTSSTVPRLERRSSVPSEESMFRQRSDFSLGQVNAFTVTFRLLQLHGLVSMGVRISMDSIVQSYRLSPRAPAELPSPTASTRASSSSSFISNRPPPIHVQKHTQSNTKSLSLHTETDSDTNPPVMISPKSRRSVPKGFENLSITVSDSELVVLDAVIMVEVEDDLYNSDTHSHIMSVVSEAYVPISPTESDMSSAPASPSGDGF